MIYLYVEAQFLVPAWLGGDKVDNPTTLCRNQLYPPRQGLRIWYKSSTKTAFFWNHLHSVHSQFSLACQYILVQFGVRGLLYLWYFFHLFLCVTETPKPRLFTGLKHNLFNQSTCFSRPKSCSFLNKITALNPLFRWLAATLLHIHILTLHLYVAIRWDSYPSPDRWSVQWEKPPWGLEPRIELGPTLQQADALPTELRRALVLNMACLLSKLEHNK